VTVSDGKNVGIIQLLPQLGLDIFANLLHKVKVCRDGALMFIK